MPSLLVCETQEFIGPPSKSIAIFGGDGMAKAECGQDVEISATGCQYVRTIVSEGQATSVSDHDFNIEYLIPSVTHPMNITSDAEDSLYSSGEEVGFCVYVSVHYATFDPSTSIKHAANILRVIRTSIDTNELSCPFYLFFVETDGRGDNNHKHV